MTDAFWSDWVQTTSCGDTCGSCASVTKKRTCLSEAAGIPCTGVATKVELCNTSPCKFPRMSCCGTFKAMSHKTKIVCGPLPPDEVNVALSLPFCPTTGGIWSAWSKWSDCSGTCGQCGTASRSRTCLTTTSSCACVGADIEVRQCLVKGIWSDWAVEKHCTGSCGGCGTMVYRRTCLSTNCMCQGSPTLTQPCSFNLCVYPTKSCCDGFKAQSFQGQLMCGPLPELTESNLIESCSSCCPIGGTWSPWTQTTACTDSCGSCAQVTKIRTCLSEGQGCPCTGNTKKLEYCGTSPCKFPRNSCCGGLRAMSLRGIIVCGPLPTEVESVQTLPTCCATDGLWSNWGEWSTCQGTCDQCGNTVRTRTCLSEVNSCPCTGLSTESKQCLVTGIWNAWVVQKQCDDTCGGCGVMTYTRTCQAGCACIGATTKTEACGFLTCLYPRRSCCGTFTAGSYQGKMQCGPQPVNQIEVTNSIIPCTSNPPITTPCIATCSATCGLCGIMVDEPLQPTPCLPLTTIVRCGDDVCPFPQNACCTDFSRRAFINGQFKCIPL